MPNQSSTSTSPLHHQRRREEAGLAPPPPLHVDTSATSASATPGRDSGDDEPAEMSNLEQPAFPVRIAADDDAQLLQPANPDADLIAHEFWPGQHESLLTPAIAPRYQAVDELVASISPMGTTPDEHGAMMEAAEDSAAGIRRR